MPGVFPDYLAPVVHNDDGVREMVMMRWGMPPPPKIGGPPVTNICRSFSSFRRSAAEWSYPHFHEVGSCKR
jgi:putative SOS response-associated peptidase YedK